MNGPTASLDTKILAGVSDGSPVFLIPVLDKWLFHAPLSELTALVNDSAARVLRDRQATDPDGDIRELLDEVLANLNVEPSPAAGEIVPSMLGIIPTRGCNMACTYCHFGGPTAEVEFMRPEIATGAIDWAAARLEATQQKTFHVEFFGGEPFIARDIVELVVHRARSVAAQRNLIPMFDAATNGLFDARMCQFIGDYFDAVALSLDGPSDLQDRYRPTAGMRPSSAAVERTARLLRDTPVSLCLRMCVTRDSVERMEEIVRWMIVSFSPSTINFETLTPGELASRAGLAPPDPYLFARHAERSRRLADANGIQTVYAGAEAARPRLSFCPVGRDVVIAGPDGRLSACYLLAEEWARRGIDLDFGRVDSDGSVTIFSAALEAVRRLPQSKPRCSECFCRYSCAGGCHVNQTYPGSMTGYTDYCIQTRVLTACRLLRELGFDDVAATLVEDREAMVRLAHCGADGLPTRDTGATAAAHPDLQKKAPRTTRPPRTGSPYTDQVAAPMPPTPGHDLKTPYRIAPNVRWSVELRGLLLVDEAGTAHRLAYPQAAVWEMINQGRTLEKIIATIQSIALTDAVAATDLVRESIADWLALGWLETDPESETDGEPVDH